MTPLVKVVKKLSVIILILSSSCAHNFEKIKFNKQDNAVVQELRVKIISKDSQDSFTVYTQINRTKKQAILDGVGTAGKHLFTLKADDKEYEFIDYINKKTEVGQLNDFDVLPLNKIVLFETIDKNTKQPIVVTSKDENFKMEIRVKEQKPIE